MSVLPVGFGSSGGIDTGDIGHSLRWRRAASANIATGVTTATTSTYFALFKQGALDAINPIFDGNIKINANNTITAFGLTTTAVKRDPTSFHWIHVSNNGLIFDGVNLGAVTTSAITTLRLGYDGTNYADMYGARICCVSGTALAHTDFVYFNTEINEWVVKSQSAIKALVDAGGSASFMYDFDNATSLTTLGYDKSSKGNNATLNNFSLTAGTTYDHMLDVPGNSFATLNPIYPSAANITNGNLSSGTTAARGTLNSTVIDSQWFVTAGASNVTAGVIDDSGTTSTATVTANKVFAFKMTTAGALSYKNVTDAGSWTSIATGLTGNRWPYGVTAAASWNFGQQPLPEAFDTGFLALCQANLPEVPAAVLNPKDHFDVVTVTKSGDTNFTIPWDADLYDTFFEIKARNLGNKWYQIDGLRGYDKYLSSDATTAETTDANVLGISGTTGTLKSTLADGVYLIRMMKAGLVSARQWNFDGTMARTATMTIASPCVVTLNSNGFSAGQAVKFTTTGALPTGVTAGVTYYAGNTATNTCNLYDTEANAIAGGTTGRIDTSGSQSGTHTCEHASRVSANTDLGFSLVLFIGTGVANTTVGHGQGKAPTAIIPKQRNGGTYGWNSWHVGLSSGYYIPFNFTSAQDSSVSIFPAGGVTSPTFNTGASPTYNNANGGTYVAYCYTNTEILKCGSYTGNGSADGPNPYLGFKARAITVKRSDSTGDWQTLDTARDQENVMDAELNPNLVNAESTVTSMDGCALSFKLRTTDTGYNANGGTIIYIAIADVCGKYSLGR